MKHYYRQKRGGDLDKPSQHEKRSAIIEGNVAKLSLGVEARLGYAIIDAEYAYLDQYNWSLGGRGYPSAHVDGKLVKLHHLIIGWPPDGYEVDHKDRDKLNARRNNLWFATHKENMQNVPKELFNRGKYNATTNT